MKNVITRTQRFNIVLIRNQIQRLLQFQTFRFSGYKIKIITPRSKDELSKLTTY